jgi:hypothetical protein
MNKSGQGPLLNHPLKVCLRASLDPVWTLVLYRSHNISITGLERYLGVPSKRIPDKSLQAGFSPAIRILAIPGQHSLR